MLRAHIVLAFCLAIVGCDSGGEAEPEPTTTPTPETGAFREELHELFAEMGRLATDGWCEEFGEESEALSVYNLGLLLSDESTIRELSTSDVSAAVREECARTQANRPEPLTYQEYAANIRSITASYETRADTLAADISAVQLGEASEQEALAALRSTLDFLDDVTDDFEGLEPPADMSDLHWTYVADLRQAGFYLGLVLDAAPARREEAFSAFEQEINITGFRIISTCHEIEATVTAHGEQIDLDCAALFPERE